MDTAGRQVVRPTTVDYVCLQPMRQGQASYAHAGNIIAGLRQRGWRVRLIRPPLPHPGALDGLRRAVNVLLVQARYWARIGFRPADVVYIRTHFAALPTALLARARHALVVQELNGPVDDAFDAWPALRRIPGLITWLVRTQLRAADAIVVVTPGLATYATELTGKTTRCYVVGNGADTNLFQPVHDVQTSPGNPYAVFVGALASWQGVNVILDAAASGAWPSGVDLVIAGDGREGGRVSSAVAACPRIRWLGTIPYRQSADLVAGSIAALVPKLDSSASRFGLSPLKLFEAMASGVPVVVSDLPGLRDVVQAHDCGLIVQPGDAEALASAVRQMAGDRARACAMGQNGRRAALAEYSWSSRAGQTEKVFLELAERKRSRLR
jgi:glycosyltransferase involved in cell wall biosynthesis